jgi:drug/metabolite transporter (DMT)-like permease
VFQSQIGEWAALCVAVFWTITAMSFEAASKRVGSLPVNLIRLMMAFFLLSIFGWVTRGIAFPTDATASTWGWLTISGLIGFLLGDLFLFRAFVEIGSRISMLIMALVPPITAVIGWLMLGERLSALDIFAMALTIGGIALVVLDQNASKRGFKLNHPWRGVLLAFGGALGQAIGLVLSKYGMGSYDAFAATQIRIIAGIIGFSLLFFPLKRWPRVSDALKDRKAMIPISVGAFFGPFLGVSLSLFSIKYTETGVASTIMAIVPVLIIPPAVLIFKEKITPREIIGALIAVCGVALLFLTG